MLIKTRILFAAYLAAGIICLSVIVVAHVPQVAGRLTRVNRSGFGDLYDNCKVRDFKTRKRFERTIAVPPAMDHNAKPEFSSIEDARVIIEGDSFFDSYFGQQFARVTGLPVYNFLRKFHRDKQPYDALSSQGYINTGAGGYFIYEIAERGVVFQYKRFKNMETEEDVDPAPDNMPDKRALEFLVTENPVIYKLLEARNTFRFRAFGLISAGTPYYSTSPPMLFYKPAIAVNRMRKSDDFVQSVADDIAETSRILKEEHGLTLIYLPVPNKFTIYGYRYGEYEYNYTGLSYDNFLPRLYRELDKRGVVYIDLYTDFMRYKDGLLYHPSDSHWNNKGMSIAMVKLVDKLNELEAASSSRPQNPETAAPHTP